MDYLVKISQIVANIAAALPIIIFIIAGIGSFISNGNFFTWILAIPIFIWVLICLIAIVILIYKRSQKISESKHKLQRTYLYSPDFELLQQAEMHGSQRVCVIQYNNCIWTVKIVNKTLYYMMKNRESSESLLIEIPPKCKSCQTDLFERLGFWGGYIWECKRCNQKIKSSDSFLINSQYALSVAKSEVEQKR